MSMGNSAGLHRRLLAHRDGNGSVGAPVDVNDIQTDADLWLTESELRLLEVLPLGAGGSWDEYERCSKLGLWGSSLILQDGAVGQLALTPHCAWEGWDEYERCSSLMLQDVDDSAASTPVSTPPRSPRMPRYYSWQAPSSDSLKNIMFIEDWPWDDSSSEESCDEEEVLAGTDLCCWTCG